MKRRRYPYREGETLVLGPEIFVTLDGSVIAWKGVNYTPQEPEAAAKAVTP